MTDNQRNIGITVAVILLLWWVSRKNKEEVLATGGEETISGGLGGFGGGLGILNITPPTPPPTPVVITGGSSDPTSVTTPPAKNPSGSVADPSLPVVSAKPTTPSYSYRDGMALRNFTIVASNGIVHNITKGKILKVANVGGSSVTYPELNPSKPLQMGVDVDYASSSTGSIPTGGIAGGLPINTGTSTGGSVGNVGGVLGGNANPSGTPTNSSTGAIPTAGGAIKL